MHVLLSGGRTQFGPGRRRFIFLGGGGAAALWRNPQNFHRPESSVHRHEPDLLEAGGGGGGSWELGLAGVPAASGHWALGFGTVVFLGLILCHRKKQRPTAGVPKNCGLAKREPSNHHEPPGPAPHVFVSCPITASHMDGRWALWEGIHASRATGPARNVFGTCPGTTSHKGRRGKLSRDIRTSRAKSAGAARIRNMSRHREPQGPARHAFGQYPSHASYKDLRGAFPELPKHPGHKGRHGMLSGYIPAPRITRTGAARLPGHPRAYREPQRPTRPHGRRHSLPRPRGVGVCGAPGLRPPQARWRVTTFAKQVCGAPWRLPP